MPSFYSNHPYPRPRYVAGLRRAGRRDNDRRWRQRLIFVKRALGITVRKQ